MVSPCQRPYQASTWSCVFNRAPAARLFFVATRSQARSRQSAIESARRSNRMARLEPTCERSEEHTSELQSRLHLVCRLLLEKKKYTITTSHDRTVERLYVLV